MTKRIFSAVLAVGWLAAGASVASAGQVQLARYRPLGADVAANHNTTSLDCLTAPAHALIDRIQAKFGTMQIVSTCRPGARVAGSGELSRHSSGNAIDFNAGSRKSEVVAWLIANHTTGGTMTYNDADHIHVDIGPHWVILAGRQIVGQ